MFADTLKDSNNVLLTGGVIVNSTEADFAVAVARIHEMISELENFAIDNNGNNPLRYLNYAAMPQNPLASYGKKSVEYMKKVAKKYDPKGLLQTRFPGGFKISRVED